MNRTNILVGFVILFLGFNSSVMATNMTKVSSALKESINVLLAKGEGDSPLRVIDLLSSPLEKQDIDLMIRYGGKVNHRYHRVINGLSGTIPAGAIAELESQWGSKLTLLDLDQEMKQAMERSPRPWLK